MLQPVGPRGDAAYYDNIPHDSLILTRFGIAPGETVKISANDAEFGGQWHGGYFMPRHFIYVGSSDIWLLYGSEVRQTPVVEADTPLDTYRPPAPSFVNWPPFDMWDKALNLALTNRGDTVGHFVARVAGQFHRDMHEATGSFSPPGYSGGGGRRR